MGGIPKTANGGFSTFYSKNLSPQQVVDAINEAYSNCELKLGTRNTYQGEAYQNRVYIRGNIYSGLTSSGMEIEMFLEKNEKIISAYPVY